MPRVSVIIPTYNRADLVGETIQSALDQTYSDYEVIVLDDGSTDNTAEVVAQFGERVNYVYQDNVGETGARNAGIAVAQGELLSFLDSDDCMLPNNLEDLVALLDARPEVGVAYGWYYWMDQDGQPVQMEYPKIAGAGFAEHVSPVSPWPGVSLPPSGPTLEGQIFSRLILEETMLIGSTLIRRECVDAVGGFDPDIAYQGHWDFYLRVASAGYAYACCKRPVVLIRLHPNSRGKNIDGMLASRIDVLDRLFADPASASVSAGVRNRAYYEAYVEFLLEYHHGGREEQAAHCWDKAIRHAPLKQDHIPRLAKWMFNHTLSSDNTDPAQLARDLMRPMPPTATARRFRREVLGKINAELAFRHYQAGEPGQVWRHALKAVRHDPAWMRNRGLARIALEGVTGSRTAGRIHEPHP
jgi:glycosyltransferase involved in cell wall biosynthesis